METKQLVKIIELTELPKQIGKEVHVEGKSIALFHLGNGEVRAIGSTCPHTNGPLAEGIVAGEYVFCPLQNWKVSLITGEVQKPDDGIVEVFKTAVKDGFVYIEV
ncbi:nitrite reductase small subunit NirD [Bacillus sp. FJAT-50079]|uniref:nitrite reductase small subunit NirD n=1 Tax=Bacillus sp. FJAT-50079 TaxID=2833577 RepID=UPI001BC9CC66|nr:nitrite reductase small subunit NirD [Bacillus sp. FJAT-50079]MBS4209467.1 nitrite reductase small subunit NirD [Bacillus sp. FJAT-50079]